MAVKNLRQRIVAFVAGLLLGPTVVWAGLESATYISDLVASNPLSSDLASTADDHIRLLKSTIKTTFPNINNAVTVTDEQLNTISGITAANPSASIGLSAVNGTATTYLRSDGAPALSQAIAPTWSDTHTFSKTGGGTTGAVVASSASPFFVWNETDAAADNRAWQMGLGGERFFFDIVNDANNAGNSVMLVDRTGVTVDRVAFPTDINAADCCFLVGTDQAGTITGYLTQIRTTATSGALYLANATAASASLYINSQVGAGDNVFASFATETTLLGTVRGSIDYNRAGGAVRYNTTSDQRLKKNFKPAPSAGSVIDCIQIESFDWRDTGNHVDHGLVAQRLEKCAPYAVSKGKVWQVDKSTLIPALIKYVQEQDARIARLEADAARRH